MQKKLERLDFIIRDAYADGKLEHNIYTEATQLLIDLSRQLKILNMPGVVGRSEQLKCEMCGRTDVSSSTYCPDCSWHHNPIP